jgi:hypothetical protein
VASYALSTNSQANDIVAHFPFLVKQHRLQIKAVYGRIMKEVQKRWRGLSQSKQATTEARVPQAKAGDQPWV